MTNLPKRNNKTRAHDRRTHWRMSNAVGDMARGEKGGRRIHCVCMYGKSTPRRVERIARETNDPNEGNT